MEKSRNVGLYLLLGALLFGSISLYATDPATKEPTVVVFSSVEGKEWAVQCTTEHPEILWLADSDVHKTEEGQATAQGAYSEQIFGHKYIEFDRTLMTLYCLKLILDGTDEAYRTFTAAQPKEVQLSRESFHALHLQGQTLLKSTWGGLSEMQMAQAMETALVLGDIGKSARAREVFKPYGIGAPDHDDFHGEAMQVIAEHPELSPSFARLPTPAKQLLVETANLAHYGHVTHLEGGLEMLSKLKESGLAVNDPTAVTFDLFVHICDVAGALGHVNKESSLMYTEHAHRAVQATNDAIKVLFNPNKHELDVYNAYLAVRASWLGLNPSDRSDRVLARVGAMLRLVTLDDGVVLRKAMDTLDPATREHIASQLDVGSKGRPGRTPTYMPAVLVNLSNNPSLGTTREERLTKAMTVGLPLIARVLATHQELLREGAIDPNIPLNFNAVAGVAKTSPASLDGPFDIDQEGNVRLTPEK